MENIIEFENVSKSFGDLQVLKNLNLEVKDGEKLALIGWDSLKLVSHQKI